MTRFLDQRSADVCATGLHTQIPKHITKAAREDMQLLMAACSLQDGSVIRLPIFRWFKLGRYGFRVEGKWFVTFEWDDAFGARAILLERLKED